MKKFFRGVANRLPSGAQVGGAIRSVIGDKLPQQFALPMKFFKDGKPFQDHAHISRAHVCIFVHGSADTEAGWNAKPPALQFGESLLLDFNAEPLYLRFNSGLSVSESGEALSNLIESLCAKHKAIRKISFVGHSMGGLVVHSAIYHGSAQRTAWVKKVKQVFLLGTPHAGAPLAKFAEKSEQVLQFIPNPITLIAASVIGLRSRGLKDLSQGEAGLPAQGKILLPGATYVFIAGGLQKDMKGFLNRLIGDGMVRHQSAHRDNQPQNWLKQTFPTLMRSPRIHVEAVGGVGHLALRNAPAVYAIISRYFKS